MAVASVCQIYTCEYTDATSENADSTRERGAHERVVTAAAMDEEIRPSPLAKIRLPGNSAARAPARLLHQTDKLYTLGAGSVRSALFRPSAPLTCYRRRLLLHDEHELTAFGYAS